MTDAPFFDAIRPLFNGLSEPQVAGLNRYLGEARRRRLAPETVAYIMATGFHETGRTMQPVREAFATSDEQAVSRLETAWKDGKLPWVKTPYWRKDEDGKSWFGRGDVQLTHKANYETMGELLDVDLVGNPDLALDPAISIKVIYEGMLKGLFTGKPLGAYVKPAEGKVDFVSARKVVNGTDKAETIAGYAGQFLAALRKIDLLAESRTIEAAKKAEGASNKGLASVILGGLMWIGEALFGTPDNAADAAKSGENLAPYFPWIGGGMAVLGVAFFVYTRVYSRYIAEVRKDDQQKAGS